MVHEPPGTLSSLAGSFKSALLHICCLRSPADLYIMSLFHVPLRRPYTRLCVWSPISVYEITIIIIIIKYCQEPHACPFAQEGPRRTEANVGCQLLYQCFYAPYPSLVGVFGEREYLWKSFRHPSSLSAISVAVSSSWAGFVGIRKCPPGTCGVLCWIWSRYLFRPLARLSIRVTSGAKVSLSCPFGLSTRTRTVLNALSYSLSAWNYMHKFQPSLRTASLSEPDQSVPVPSTALLNILPSLKMLILPYHYL